MLVVSPRYRTMLAYPRRRWPGWSAILAVTLAANLAALLMPLPLQVLIDDVLGHGRAPAWLGWLPGSGSRGGLAIWVAAAELSVFVLTGALEAASTYLWTVVGQGTVFDVARDVFARVQRRSLREAMREPVGDSIERVAGDSWSVHTVLDELLMTPLAALCTVAVLTLAMIRLDAGLALIAWLVAPLMALAPVLLGRRIRSVAESQRRLQGRLHAHVQQTLAGLPVVIAFGQEDRQHAHFERLARRAVQLQSRSVLLGGFGNLGSGLAAAAGTGIVLLIGAHAVLAHRLTIGELLVFVNYLGVLQGQLAGLTGIYSVLQGARPSVDRVVEVLDAPPEVADPPGAVPLARVRGELQVRGVTFAYEPGRPVLAGVSFRVAPGETVAVVGSTGAGKSTLVGLLPRFYDPDAGEVRLDGHDLRDLPLAQVRRSVSMVLQDSYLFPLTIEENLRLARPHATFEEIVEAARAANALPFVERLPEGFATVLGEGGASLSGGERQRLAIARAVLKDAPVLVLDEPTSALDVETEALVLSAIDRLAAGRSVIVIAHRLSTVRRADRILVMDRGRIVEQGRHEELLARGGGYARMCELQFAAEDA